MHRGELTDAYDAMNHDRPYKRAIGHDQAINELRRNAGTQFDPELVGLFCDLFASHAPEADPTLALLAGLSLHPTPTMLGPARESYGVRKRRATDPATPPTAPSTDSGEQASAS